MEVKMSSTSPTTVMSGIFAILVGLGAAYGVRVNMTPPPVQEPKPAPVVEKADLPKVNMGTIVMASRNISPYETLTAENLRIISIPEEELKNIREKATSKEDLPIQNINAALNRVAKTEIIAGNWLTEECLYEFGKVPTLEDKLQPDELAMSIPVDQMNSVAGFVHPNALINISWLPKEKIHPDFAEDIAISIYKNVRVLATSSDMHEFNPGEPRKIENITIAVDQQMANILNVLQKKGTFSIMLASASKEASLEKDCKEHETIFKILGLEAPEETIEGTAQTDAWEGTHKKTNKFNSNEVLESINATRVVNNLQPLKKLPKKSADPNTVNAE